MSFRLIERGWRDEIDQALSLQRTEASIICPYIKYRVAEHILARSDAKSMRVITRFNLEDFANGVSDISALKLLQRKGVQVRGIRNLHAKLYIFGNKSVILTSANLTGAGLATNHEFGCVAHEAPVIEKCQLYFADRWAAGKPTTLADLSLWQKTVDAYNAAVGQPVTRPLLLDYGADQSEVDGSEPLNDGEPIRVTDAEHAFVKFFGTSANRADRSLSVLDEVTRSTSHAVLSYPLDRRPRQIQDGDVVYIARLVKSPNDIAIYGRAIGMRHDESRDNATSEDIFRRSWRAEWPHYIRVHHAEFMGGTLENAISLSGLMAALGHNAFASTQRNFIAGVGNTNPRHAFQQKPSVQLTPMAMSWLNQRMAEAFQRYGTLSPAELDAII